jgi:hypothetical protein
VIEQRVLDQRGRLLIAALGFAGLPHPSYDCALWALRTWLDSWSSIGRIAVGMAHQGFVSSSRATTSAAGARPSTRRDGALAHERDRHRLGADAVARHAAGGVGRSLTKASLDG